MFIYRPCFVGRGKKIHANPQYKSFSEWADITCCCNWPVKFGTSEQVNCKLCLKSIGLYGGKRE